MSEVAISFDTSSLDDYRKFLAVRRCPVYRISGLDGFMPEEYAASVLGVKSKRRGDINYDPSPFLFDYQRDITRLAIRKRKFAAFIECGLGKTLVMLEFARHALEASGKPILLISPLMVVPQTIDEAERFYPGMEIKQVRPADLQDWLDKGSGIGITNFEAFNQPLRPGKLGGLLIDECFAPGTKVACVDDSGNRLEKDIENILCGDKIINAAGVDEVIKTKRREVSHAIAVTAGERITCSPNHPFFTQRGWVCAQDLRPGDSIAQTGTALRMVRGEFSSGYIGGRPAKVLQSILLSELENAGTDAHCQGPYAGNASQNRQEQISLASHNEGWSSTDQAVCGNKTHADSRNAGEGEQDAAGHEAQTFRAWWERDRIDATAEDFAGCSVRELEGGVCCIAGPTTAGISHKLQARLGEHRTKGWHRIGRSDPSFTESRQEERCETGFVRVDGIEVLEPGHPELERCRNADGKLYFYDLEASRHPSYSVDGLLVHNSSMLKSHYGKWGTSIIQLGRGIEWKLALTGTPAPNDRIEYANHAVFLDACRTTNEFLARYFVNRGQTDNRWELMPHALGRFYRDLSHWCIFLSNPAVYGWKDNAESIPPIHVNIHRVDMTAIQRQAVMDMTGTLFVGDIGGIGTRSKLGQIAKGKFAGERIATNKPQFIHDLIKSFGKESTLVWCKYNDEQDQVAAALPGCANLSGDTPIEERLELIAAFKAGQIKSLVSKGKILGFGLNLQRATRQVFSTLEDSYETYWQCVKRSNRVGSKLPLNAHVPITEVEEPMVQNVLRKAKLVQQDTEEQARIFKEMAWNSF